jgi:hypothetical protein
MYTSGDFRLTEDFSQLNHSTHILSLEIDVTSPYKDLSDCCLLSSCVPSGCLVTVVTRTERLVFISMIICCEKYKLETQLETRTSKAKVKFICSRIKKKAEAKACSIFFLCVPFLNVLSKLIFAIS